MFVLELYLAGLSINSALVRVVTEILFEKPVKNSRKMLKGKSDICSAKQTPVADFQD